MGGVPVFTVTLFWAFIRDAETHSAIGGSLFARAALALMISNLFSMSKHLLLTNR